MAVDLEAIHVAVAGQLRARLQRASSFNISPYPNSGMELPSIEVWPGDDKWVGYYDESDDDDGAAPVHLRIFVETSTDPESGFKVMADLASRNSPSSIRAAIMSDRSLGGVVDSAVVLSAEGYQLDEGTGIQSMWVPVDIIAVMDGPT